MAKSRRQRKAERRQREDDLQVAGSSQSTDHVEELKEPVVKPPAPKPAQRAERHPGKVRQRSRVITFLSEVRAELRRVQWPDRQTLMQATGVVIVTVLIAAAYLGVLDLIFGKLIHRLL